MHGMGYRACKGRAGTWTEAGLGSGHCGCDGKQDVDQWCEYRESRACIHGAMTQKVQDRGVVQWFSSSTWSMPLQHRSESFSADTASMISKLPAFHHTCLRSSMDLALATHDAGRRPLPPPARKPTCSYDISLSRSARLVLPDTTSLR